MCLGITPPVDRQSHQHEKGPHDEQIADDDQGRQFRGPIAGHQMRNAPRDDERVQHHDDHRNTGTSDAESAMQCPSSRGD